MATHAPIMGAPTRAPVIPVPPAAITRVLSRFDRDQLAGFITVAIDLLDVAAGDPDLEDGGDDELTGDEGDASFPEWAGRRTASTSPTAMQNEDAEDCDPAEDNGDAEDNGGAEDDFGVAVESRGAGCPLADGTEPWHVAPHWGTVAIPANDTVPA